MRKINLKQIFFNIARSPLSSFFIGKSFQYFSGLLPVEKLYENKNIIVFIHPVPFWQFHCLAVPKKNVPSLIKLDINTHAGQNIITSVFCSLQIIAAEKKLINYKVMVNGGSYQDVPQMHFHLASGLSKGELDPKYKWEVSKMGLWLGNYRSAIIYAHPNPLREKHLVITSIEDIPIMGKLDFTNQTHVNALLDIFSLAQITIKAQELTAYSIITEVDLDDSDPQLCFHLLSGPKVSDRKY
jgi:histidine triad (HIT) family protein